MKLYILFGLAALLVAGTSSAPVEQQALQETEYFVADVLRDILNVIQEEGKQAGIEMVQRLIKKAKGAMKAALEDLLERLKEEEAANAYLLENMGLGESISSVLRDILNVIQEEGKQAGIEMVQRLIKRAKGAMKAVLEDLLERLQDEEADNSYLLENMGIGESITSVMRDILNVIQEEGKQAGIEMVQRLIQRAKGAMKKVLEDLLERLREDEEDDAYLLENINIEQIKDIYRVLVKEGKSAAIRLAKKMIEEAQGALKELLSKVLEILERSDDAYLLESIGIDVQKIQAIYDELFMYGKDAAIKLAKTIKKEVKGTLRDVIQKIIESLEDTEDSYIIGIIHHINFDWLRDIISEISGKGKEAAIKLAEKLKGAAKGTMIELIEKMLEIIERTSESELVNGSGINMQQVKAIYEELIKSGKEAAIKLAKLMVAEAKGSLREIIVSILEILERSDDAFLLENIGIDTQQIRAIYRELFLYGKEAAIELAKKIKKETIGTLRDVIEKIIESLEEDSDAYYSSIIGIEWDQIKAIYRELAENGKEAAIKMAERLLAEATGYFKELLSKVLEIISQYP